LDVDSENKSQSHSYFLSKVVSKQIIFVCLIDADKKMFWNGQNGLMGGMISSIFCSRLSGHDTTVDHGFCEDIDVE
jgi:hypothetical protein